MRPKLSKNKKVTDELLAIAMSKASVTPFLPAGTQGAQIGMAPDVVAFAQTVNAAAAVVDTGSKAPNTHGGTAILEFSAIDRTAGLATGNSILVVVKWSAAGVLTAAQTLMVAANVGDGALATCTVTAGATAGNTIQLTFAPPAGYVGTIDWVARVIRILN